MQKIGDFVYYEIEDLEKLLKVTPVTLRRYMREGIIRGRKLAGRWVVTEETLKEYLDNKPINENK